MKQKLDEKQILTSDGSTLLKSIMQENFTDYILEGMYQTDAYMEAYPKCNNRTTARINASKLLTKSNVKARLEYKRAEIERASGIDIAYCQYRLIKLADLAEAKGQYNAARACISDPIKTKGGFQADAPSDKAIALKQIDSDAKVRIAEALGNFYSDKYLASKPVESHEVIDAA